MKRKSGGKRFGLAKIFLAMRAKRAKKITGNKKPESQKIKIKRTITKQEYKKSNKSYKV